MITSYYKLKKKEVHSDRNEKKVMMCGKKLKMPPLVQKLLDKWLDPKDEHKCIRDQINKEKKEAEERRRAKNPLLTKSAY